MTVDTFSRLGANIAPQKVLQSYRTIKTVLACRTRRFDISAVPCFDEAGTSYFRERLEHTENYLEYGSGGSTVFASRQVNILVSVDTDAHFLAAVRRKLSADSEARKRHSSRGAITKLIHVNVGLTTEWGMPAFMRPTPRRIRRWEDYPTAPWRYFRSIEQRPNLILVDGRFRVACVLESLLSLDPLCDTQILLDDYVSRPHYHIVERFSNLQLAGRMAVLRPKQSWDRSEARRMMEQYRADPR